MQKECLKILENGKWYIEADYHELLLWEAKGLTPMTVLVDDTWVDIGKRFD